MHLTLDPADLDRLAELVADKLAFRIQPQTGGDDRLMTEPEAAAFCRVEIHTLRDARRRGVLEYCRAGRFPRYSRAQLDAWMTTRNVVEAK